MAVNGSYISSNSQSTEVRFIFTKLANIPLKSNWILDTISWRSGLQRRILRQTPCFFSAFCVTWFQKFLLWILLSLHIFNINWSKSQAQQISGQRVGLRIYPWIRKLFRGQIINENFLTFHITTLLECLCLHHHQPAWSVQHSPELRHL